jgi:hypothetical protein
MWQKQMEETMCLATQVFSFSLSDGNSTSCIVMKLVMSNICKQEIVTMGRCFRKWGNDECVPYNTSSDGFTPCIAWVASCALLKSKYGQFFFNPFFSKRVFTNLFFPHFGKFSPQKNAYADNLITIELCFNAWKYLTLVFLL